MIFTFLYFCLSAFYVVLPQKQVDCVVYNAKVYMVDSSFSIQQAFAIKNGIIVKVGSNNQILQTYTAPQLINAKGKTIFPGFIDAHAHFMGYAQSLFTVELGGAASMNEVVKRLKNFAAAHPSSSWIIGHGWDQNLFPNKEFPTNELLNEAFPNIPVFLERIDGHAALVNAQALHIAHVSADTAVVGGIVQTKNGKPTGILIDQAVQLVVSFIPKPSKATYTLWLQQAQQNCFAQGLTTITDCGVMANDVLLLDSLQQNGKLQIRLYAMLSDEEENYKKFLSTGPYKTNKLFVNAFKVYADGALGSRGACLSQSYADKPNWNGFLLHSIQHYDSVAHLLAASKFQMCTHAIGDSANRFILHLYQKHLSNNNNRRWRIEHAQVVHANDVALFKTFNIIPSMQPTHATSDMYWAESRLGKSRLPEAYALKTLLQQNGWIALGTDFPVEDISPFKTFYAAVFRKNAQGFPPNGFLSKEALTKEETLKGMTIWAAKAAFWENEIGSIEENKQADFIILNQDFMQAAENKILQTKVIATYISGKKVYEAAEIN